MSESEAVVARFFDEVLNGRRLELVDELFAPEHVYHDPQITGTEPGPAGVRQLARVYQDGIPDSRWEVSERVSSGDIVVTRWVERGHQTAPLLSGIPATGREVEIEGVWIHHVREGRIRESWNVWDTLGLMQQVGATEME